MIRRAVFALVTATALTSPALALETPAADPDDANMRTIEWKANNRALLVGAPGHSSVVTVCPGESIVRAIFGDEGTTWKGPDPQKLADHPLGRVLPLWAKSVGRTDIQIITTKADGSDKVYQIAAVVREPKPAGSAPVASGSDVHLASASKADPGDDPEAIYGLTYRCSAEQKAAAVQEARAKRTAQAAVWRQQHAKVELAVAKAKIEADAQSAPRNVRYVGMGSASLAPVDVHDDGQQTGFRFPNGTQLPAIYTPAIGKECDGKNEQLVPFVMDGGAMVLQRTAPEFCIRLGQAVLNVYNLGYTRGGPDPGTGTTSPSVVRELRAAVQ